MNSSRRSFSHARRRLRACRATRRRSSSSALRVCFSGSFRSFCPIAASAAGFFFLTSLGHLMPRSFAFARTIATSPASSLGRPPSFASTAPAATSRSRITERRYLRSASSRRRSASSENGGASRFPPLRSLVPAAPLVIALETHEERPRERLLERRCGRATPPPFLLLRASGLGGDLFPRLAPRPRRRRELRPPLGQERVPKPARLRRLRARDAEPLAIARARRERLGPERGEANATHERLALERSEPREGLGAGTHPERRRRLRELHREREVLAHAERAPRAEGHPPALEEE
jgi:hypothetical protein